MEGNGAIQYRQPVRYCTKSDLANFWNPSAGTVPTTFKISYIFLNLPIPYLFYLFYLFIHYHPLFLPAPYNTVLSFSLYGAVGESTGNGNQMLCCCRVFFFLSFFLLKEMCTDLRLSDILSTAGDNGTVPGAAVVGAKNGYWMLINKDLLWRKGGGGGGCLVSLML